MDKDSIFEKVTMKQDKANSLRSMPWMMSLIYRYDLDSLNYKSVDKFIIRAAIGNLSR